MQGKSQQAQYTKTSSTFIPHSWWPGSRSCRVESRSSKPTTHLPSTYTSVPPVALRANNFIVPVVQGPIRLTNFLATAAATAAAAAAKEEDGWLNLVKAAIEKQAVDNWISWSVYHANAHHAIIPPPSINALLPLFTASAYSTAMLCHSLDITKEAVQCLSCEQIPVLSAEQRLFTMLLRNTMDVQSAAGKMQSKQKNQIAALKSDCGLFSRLYICCQTRHGDLDEFFSHENHAVQPALSTGGKLRVGVKSDLLNCLESSPSEDRSEALLNATVLGDAAIVQMPSCGRSKTFQEYADTLFAPYISLQKNCPIDLVWDGYLPERLKGATREKRGTGNEKSISLCCDAKELERMPSCR